MGDGHAASAAIRSATLGVESPAGERVVDLTRQRDVLVGDAARGMRHQGECDGAPTDVDIRVVIGAFGTSGIVFMKMLGIGMLVALLIDATVVRALLVPAEKRRARRLAREQMQMQMQCTKST